MKGEWKKFDILAKETQKDCWLSGVDKCTGESEDSEFMVGPICTIMRVSPVVLGGLDQVKMQRRWTDGLLKYLAFSKWTNGRTMG